MPPARGCQAGVAMYNECTFYPEIAVFTAVCKDIGTLSMREITCWRW